MTDINNLGIQRLKTLYALNVDSTLAGTNNANTLTVKGNLVSVYSANNNDILCYYFVIM